MGLKDDGTWMVFYARPCTHLDRNTNLCTVHGTNQQPWTCKDYAAHLCWYRRAFSQEQSLEFIRFDARRLSLLIEKLTYDVDTGEIVSVPSWEEMIALLSPYPLDNPARRALQGKWKELRFSMPAPQNDRHLRLFEFRRQFPGVRILEGKRRWVTVVETYSG